jgi:hypothetical protein
MFSGLLCVCMDSNGPSFMQISLCGWLGNLGKAFYFIHHTTLMCSGFPFLSKKFSILYHSFDWNLTIVGKSWPPGVESRAGQIHFMTVSRFLKAIGYAQKRQELSSLDRTNILANIWFFAYLLWHLSDSFWIILGWLRLIYDSNYESGIEWFIKICSLFLFRNYDVAQFLFLVKFPHKLHKFNRNHC